MQNQAASAANPSQASIFGEDGKLSSASAATSLKYAKPQDLPSFPSSGGQMSAAGAAASLASSNRKSFEHWKPEPIPAANRAAMLAKDHKMDPLWKPEASAAGSKAAMMAHANPTQVEPMQPKKSVNNKTAVPSAAYDTPENTHRKALMAANAASHNRRRSGSLPTQPVAKPSPDSSWAMKAANKSHRDGLSSPAAAPFASGDPGFEAARIQNVAKNNVDRQLYTAAPPVAIEVQEKNRQDTLRASAVAMAQKMYAIQQKHIDEAAGKSDGHALAASRARGSTITGTSSSAGDDRAPSAMGYENLEEAARRLAQERLAKIHDEHAEYRNYYGQTSPPSRNRLSMRLNRRRASSAADDSDSDEEQSRRIKSQMSIFQNKLAEVDSKKRQQDRDNLLQIAHRNVDAQISKMDTKVFEDTGKASPAQMEKWEKAAREKAQKDSDERMQHTGKVHIGGGKYLDQSELDAIAKARLQPTLDEISEKAEKQRARDEEERIERERKQEQADRDKARAAETAAQLKAESERAKREQKAQREAEKTQKADEKKAEKARKDEERRVQKEEEAAEKARKDEERRIQKEEEAAEKERQRVEHEENRKSKETKPGRLSALLGRGHTATATTATTTTTTTVPSHETRVEPQSTEVVSAAPADSETFHDQVTSATATSATPIVTRLEPVSSSPADTQIVTSVPESKPAEGRKSLEYRSSADEDNEVSSPSKSRVKSWMKVRFRSKSNAQKDHESTPAVDEAEPDVKGKSAERDDAVPRTDSMRDVAMAGRTDARDATDVHGTSRDVSPERSAPNNTVRDRSPSISSLSSDESQERTVPTDFALGTTDPPNPEAGHRGRFGIKNKLLKKIKPNKEKPKNENTTQATSHATDDEFEEARDQFEEEKLAPPPALLAANAEASGTKAQSPSRASRERSRFTEEL